LVKIATGLRGRGCSAQETAAYLVVFMEKADEFACSSEELAAVMTKAEALLSERQDETGRDRTYASRIESMEAEEYRRNRRSFARQERRAEQAPRRSAAVIDDTKVGTPGAKHLQRLRSTGRSSW
jgi:hypothetical protein